MKVGTHSGVFHADEAVAVAVLDLYWGGVEVVRTRDPKLLTGCNVRVDVGGKYDVETLDFDHHQRGRAGARENGYPYAAAGLVWNHFGTLLISRLYPELEQEQVMKVWQVVDEEVVQGVDALDNGVTVRQEGAPKVLSFSGVVSSLNPHWDEAQDFDARFAKAIDFVEETLLREILFVVSGIRAEQIVFQAIEEGDPRLVIFDSFVPWQRPIFESGNTTVLFGIFPAGDEWRLQALPPEPGSFSQRKSLPESWAGKQGMELAEVTGVADAVFCHPGRFICGAKSKDGILRLAEIALAD